MIMVTDSAKELKGFLKWTRLSEYAQLMFDLNVLAFQADLTRVSTFLMGREKDGRTYAEIGVPDFEKAKRAYLERLSSNTEVKQILRDVGRRQRDNVLDAGSQQN